MRRFRWSIITLVVISSVLVLIPPSKASADSDGRLNEDDATQTSAVYCTVETGITIWGIYQSKGYRLYTVHWTEINAGLAEADSIDDAVLLNTQKGQSLLALPGDELQLHDEGGHYDFFFEKADCTLTEKDLAELANPQPESDSED